MSSDKPWLDRLKPLLPIAATLTLAFASSVGIYDFSLIFYSVQVSRIVAGSFDMAYVGLAVIEATMYPALRKEAINVSRTACGTAMLMVTLSGLFKLRPELLVDKSLIGDIALALVHGVPLSYLAYKMSRVVLHPGKQVADVQPEIAAKVEPLQVEPVQHERKRTAHRVHAPKAKRAVPPGTSTPEREYPPAIMASTTVTAPYTTLKQKTLDIVHLWNAGHNKSQVARQVDLSRAGVTKHLNAALKAGLQVRQEK